MSETLVYSICVAALYVKFLATTMIQGKKAFNAGTRSAEDNNLPMAKGMPTQNAGQQAAKMEKEQKLAIEDEARWKRIIQNDIESIPFALVIFLGSIAVGANASMNSCLLIVYTSARIAHTATYALQLPKLRMLSWFTGIFCILAAIGNMVYSNL